MGGGRSGWVSRVKEMRGGKTKENQPWSSSKHVSHTRTGFLEDGVRAFLDEHSAQKMLPQCLQWCWTFREKKRGSG